MEWDAWDDSVPDYQLALDEQGFLVVGSNRAMMHGDICKLGSRRLTVVIIATSSQEEFDVQERHYGGGSLSAPFYYRATAE